MSRWRVPVADVRVPAGEAAPGLDGPVRGYGASRLVCFVMIAVWVVPSAAAAGYDFVSSVQPITVVPVTALGPVYLQKGPAWLQGFMSWEQLAVVFVLPVVLVVLLFLGLSHLGRAAAGAGRAVIWAGLVVAAIVLQVAYFLNIGGFSAGGLVVGPPMVMWARLVDAVGFVVLAAAMVWVVSLRHPGVAGQVAVAAPPSWG
jgi:hypothetical protein